MDELHRRSGPLDLIALSVVVPSLDSPWVGRTLDALAALGAPGHLDGPGRTGPIGRVEVLVVGRDADGRVPRNVPDLLFLDTERPVNPATARNLGVERARGEKILFTDADCRPLGPPEAPGDGWLAEMSRGLDRSPVVGGSVTFPRSPAASNRWALADNIASFHELLPDRPAEDDTHGPLGSLNLGVTRTAWHHVGGFDQELTTSEDFDWVLRARKAGLATAFVPRARVEHAPVRRSIDDVRGHAAWYGSNLHDFRRRHPRTIGSGPTWASRRRLALAAPAKAVTSALGIYAAHRELWRDPRTWRALPGVIAFKRAWYREVLRTWPEGPAP